MTPRSPEELARAGYDAWSRRDWDGFEALTHRKIVWVTSGLFADMDAEYLGRATVMDFLREFSGTWESIEADPEDIRAMPNGVYVRVRFSARGRDGVVVDRVFGQHLVFEDGLVRRITTYGDWERGLSALGLS